MGSAAIFSAGKVKLLKNNLLFKDGTEFTSSNLISTTNTKTLTNKTLTSPLITAGGNIDLTAAGTLGIATNAGANNITIGGSSSTLVVPGNLQVDGTTTSVNSTTMEVADANIIVNNGGNQAAADSADAGITVEMSDATDAVIGYDSTLASKFAIGETGALKEIADVSSTQTFTNKTLTSPNVNEAVALTATATELNQLDGVTVGGSTAGDIVTINATQTLTNKTIDADLNTITNIKNADIKAGAAIDAAKIHDGSVSNTEFGYLDGVTSAIQTQLDAKAVISDVFSVTSSSGTFTATANKTHLVDTSSVEGDVTLPAVATDRFVRIKDKSGNANTNNITVTPASGTIDGAATDVIDSDYGSVVYVSDGSSWFKL